MGAKYGGKKAPMHSSVITEGCTGDQAAQMYSKDTGSDGKVYSLTYQPGYKLIDLKLPVGATQNLVFQAGDPPPFYDLTAPEKDTAGTTKKGKDKIIEGFVGKPKGLKQILWERGLYHDKMVLKVGADDPKGRNETFSMVHTMASCADFKAEVGALTKVVRARGHIAIFSPKAHPEVAGAGVEFDWGISKKWFRRNNTYKPKETEGLVRASLAAVTMLMAKKTARRARTYLRAYRNPDALSYSLIEKFVKLHKTHRNILDQETAYLEKMVELCSEIKKEADFFKVAAERDAAEERAADEARLLEALYAEMHT